MSERRLTAGILLLALALVLLALASSAVGDAGEAAAIAARADAARAAFPEARMKLRISTSRPGAEAFAGEFEVLVKGPEKVRIEFLAPQDRGKLLIVNGKDAWLVLPGRGTRSRSRAATG